MFSRYSMLYGTAIVAGFTSAPVHAQARSFDIPAQAAVKAIPELARQGQIQVVASARDLAGIRTPAIKGKMDTREALRRLIAGTRLQIVGDDGQTVTLRSSRMSDNDDKRGAGAGVVRGRVLNTATGQYLHNAEVRVEGTDIVTYTDDDGSFRIAGVSSGDVAIVVRYAGLQDIRVVASIAAGRPASINVAMQPLSFGANDAGGHDITVVGVRSGEAAALM